MNAADVQRAEQIRQIGRNGGETAAEHRKDNHCRRIEQHQPGDGRVGAHRRGHKGNRQIQQQPQHEEAGKGGLAPDVVGNGGPEEAPAHIEDANHQHIEGGEGRRYDARQRGAEDVAHNGLGDADDAGAGRHIEAQHHPQQIELRRFVGLVEMHRFAGGLAGLAAAVLVGAVGRPAGGGNPVGKGGQQHDDEVERPQGEERLGRPGAAGADDIHALGGGGGQAGGVAGAGHHHLQPLPGDDGQAAPLFDDQIDRLDGAEVLGGLGEEADEEFL